MKMTGYLLIVIGGAIVAAVVNTLIDHNELNAGKVFFLIIGMCSLTIGGGFSYPREDE